MEGHTIQNELFARIRDLIPPNMALVDVLSDLLEISTDSVYRRLRNETALSIDETSRLCRHFNISFDELITRTTASSVTFSYGPLNTVSEYKQYLLAIREDLEKLAAAEKYQVYWVAKDFPIFYQFQSSFLASFMIYYWFHCILDFEEYRDAKFYPDCIDDGILKVAQDIYSLYARTPSVEIWTELTIAPLLAQIDYIWQAGLFEEPKDATRLCRVIEELVNTINRQADLSCKAGYLDDPDMKSAEGSFQLYHSDFEIGNNTILVTQGENRMVYLVHNLNKLSTINHEFAMASETWIRNRIRKSTLISGISERQRHQFFNGMRNRLKELERRIGG